jgi:hypothetical protein
VKASDAAGECRGLVTYHALFDQVFRRREQRRWSLFYLCGQLSNLERKTIEPMVLGLKGNDRDMMRAVQQFIGQSTWPTRRMILRLQALVDESLGDPAGILIVDGSGFPKQGQDSAGVAPQYCGHLGKTANCQEGVFLVYWSSQGSVLGWLTVCARTLVRCRSSRAGTSAAYRMACTLKRNRPWGYMQAPADGRGYRLLYLVAVARQA